MIPVLSVCYTGILKAHMSLLQYLLRGERSTFFLGDSSSFLGTTIQLHQITGSPNERRTKKLLFPDGICFNITLS